MEKQNHIFDDLTVIFSQERLDRYLGHAHCNNSKNEALIAYSWNIELSQALYPALQILEIALRNSLHDAITACYQTEYWFDLEFLHSREKERVTQAKDNLKKDKKPIEVGRIVAELSFGFWTSLFDVRYEHDQTLWPKLLKSTFPFLPKGQRTRTYLSRELNRIRILRNRIFHYEPIWHWKDLPQQHGSIINLIKSLSISAAQYLDHLDNFKHIHGDGKLKIKNKLVNFLINQ
jgi:hypothetical protein